MGGYEVRIKRSAIKQIEDIATKKDRRKVVSRIQSLADDPRPPGCEKLSSRGRYRVRQGWYRVVYAVDDAARVVLVVKVGHRRDVYR
ncbi:MAG: type II toxin-antitoxin system RelE family toxin [Planctomycetota bacterium]|jgi:mRNA interferase RelE/StbE